MIRRTPLRRISKKRQRELIIYRRLKKQHMAANPDCVACGEPAKDIHHKTPRGRGGAFLDPANFLSICRPCHERIHNNPKWATANNLLTP